MITCPTCGQESLEGALLCSKCGTYFKSGGHLTTDPLAESEVEKTATGFAAPTFDTAPIGATLILKGVSEEREIVVPRKMSSALFGRNDRLAGLMVDIDLTSADGQTHGVSRRHARIRFVNDRYLVEDLESLNGTYLNRRKLVPFVPEVLRDGDDLRFGSLSFTVVLKEPENPESK
jgi:pSer/pThr/pTyr-binding forkhead associated (FHA) protein